MIKRTPPTQEVSAKKPADVANTVEVGPEVEVDVDPSETVEWLESLEDVYQRYGPERVGYLLTLLDEAAYRRGVTLPFTANTPYINTIPVEKQPRYPGNRDIERRIKSIVRWNAMAMVVRANRESPGIGGHISTYASAATLLEVAFNHFLRGKGNGFRGDQVFLQGHASPGVYARAFLEGRLSADDLANFRRELRRGPGGGLSSYPHPWLMPGLLGVPDGFDGPVADHGHLPGTVQPLPRRSRHQGHLGLPRLVLHGRRRNG